MDGFYSQQFGDAAQGVLSPTHQLVHDDAMSGIDDGSIYQQQTSQPQSQRPQRLPNRNASLSDVPYIGTSYSAGGDMQQQSSQQQQQQQQQQNQQRRLSMPEFAGAGQGSQLNGFQFAPSGTGGQNIMLPSGAIFQPQHQNQPLQLVTGLIDPSSQSFSMLSPQDNSRHNIQMQMAMQSDMNSNAALQSMQNQQNMNNQLKNMQPQMGMLTNSGHFIPGIMVNQMPSNMSMGLSTMSQSQGRAGTGNSSLQTSPVHSNASQMSPNVAQNSSQMQTTRSPLHMVQNQSSPMQPVSNNFDTLNFGSHMSPHVDNSGSATPKSSVQHSQVRPQQQQQQQQQRQRQQQQHLDLANQQWASAPQTQQSTHAMDETPDNFQSNYTNAYSSTGFDMLNILVRVATRPNPEINIGAVDLSCAFVVCDAHEYDFPIIYVSENFERLTGYTRHEILGRNCRFLQSPDGKVQSGVKRQYVDDDAVAYLKRRIATKKEAQVSLINYRKGGQPFMNLLTMIPVKFDDGDTRYFVGFQVDLVEQPNSVTNKNKDGSYTVNYQRGLSMPKYTYSRPEPMAHQSGQTVTRDDVSTALGTIGSGESDLTKKIWDKILLENTDDVVFVLSLKGLFLYLSPSSQTVLEYESNELVGTALSSLCHPSDIVPVTRELKDTAPSSTVDVVFRIRRKNSGYMWFEGHGCLHTEQGKGRKSIVLVGRERPVYSLSTADILAAGGIGDNEMWTKLSTSGMFLFVSSNVRALLDRTPEELVGSSFQSLMRQASRAEFLRILEVTLSGRVASAKHELLNKRGQVLQAISTIYPGDAPAGSKPTFFVAQTRLIKYTRPGAASRTTSSSKHERDSSTTKLGLVKAGVGLQGPGSSTSAPSPMHNRGAPSPSQFMSSFEAATTYGGADGLALGRQDEKLASELNLFDELKTTRSTSWQFELRQMEKRNRLLAEELQGLLAARKKRKRRKGAGMIEKDCANCHTKQTPEWRRGPSGNRDLCNSSCTARCCRTFLFVQDISKIIQQGGRPEHTCGDYGEYRQAGRCYLSVVESTSSTPFQRKDRISTAIL